MCLIHYRYLINHLLLTICFLLTNFLYQNYKPELCILRGCHGHDRMVSLNPAYGKVYPIQLYVMKLVSDFQQVSGFFRVLRFPPPIKLTTEILLKVVLNTITLTPNLY
jgi:hypothetical protein